ncbi:MAG: hypothetical protein NTY00_07860 [Deltaproteobacteria bacterium]|nr:hypothetical protein [Deltaproteobacteria bacterium]
MKKLITTSFAISCILFSYGQVSADDDVKLGTKHYSASGAYQEKYVLENTNSNTAKKVTVKYTDTNNYSDGLIGPRIYTKTYTVEPGEVIDVGEKSFSSINATNNSVKAEIVGARDVK